MALELWFREDARHALLTVAVASLGAAVGHGSPDVSYCRGTLDALRASCCAFGVPWAPFLAELRGILAAGDVLATLDASSSVVVVDGRS